MKYIVYVLKCGNGNLYIGQTQNLEERLKRHNSNYERSTKNKGPFLLIHQEKYKTRTEAMRREKILKFGQGREWLKKNFINGA